MEAGSRGPPLSRGPSEISYLFGGDSFDSRGEWPFPLSETEGRLHSAKRLLRIKQPEFEMYGQNTTPVIRTPLIVNLDSPVFLYGGMRRS